MRQRQEQMLSALCHLFNAVPIWGLLFCGWIWFQVREESRAVRRQAQQAMLFHVLMMGGLLIWILVEWISRILHGLALYWASAFVSKLNGFIIQGLLLGYVAVCLFGAWRIVSGRAFRYPLVRRRR